MQRYINEGRKLRCYECGSEFEPWDEVYSWDYGGTVRLICEDCFDSLFDELGRDERAALLGSRVMTAEEFV